MKQPNVDMVPTCQMKNNRICTGISNQINDTQKRGRIMPDDLSPIILTEIQMDTITDILCDMFLWSQQKEGAA